MRVTFMTNILKWGRKNKHLSLQTLSGAGRTQAGLSNQSSTRAPKFSWGVQGPDCTLDIWLTWGITADAGYKNTSQHKEHPSNVSEWTEGGRVERGGDTKWKKYFIHAIKEIRGERRGDIHIQHALNIYFRFLWTVESRLTLPSFCVFLDLKSCIEYCFFFLNL